MTPRTYQVGDVRAHLLSDGFIWTDGGGAFGVVPRVLWQRIVEPDDLGRIPMETRSLLIEIGAGVARRLILVDTGHGDKLSPKRRGQLSLQGEQRLVGDLAQLGFRPTDIDLVINTHLHEDHCGGNTYLDKHGQIAPTFPNATILVQRLELADASYPNERTRNTYFSENFLPLGAGRKIAARKSAASPSGWLPEIGEGVTDGALQVVSGDTQICPEVRTLVTPGHTRAHQVVIIESQGESAMFLADAAGWAVSLERLAWVPAYDVEPLVSIESKRALRAWAGRKNALLFFQHDIAIAAGRMRWDGKHWQVAPEET